MADDEPTLRGIHHLALTVRDVEASAEWYSQVLGMMRLPVTFPHHDREETGYAVLLMAPGSGIVVGLHHHTANAGEAFDEGRAGLDHVGFGVEDPAALEAWAARLDELGIEHSGIRSLAEPIPFSTLVFRDPDGIQLELYADG